jgi:hypothetical protein
MAANMPRVKDTWLGLELAVCQILATPDKQRRKFLLEEYTPAPRSLLDVIIILASEAMPAVLFDTEEQDKSSTIIKPASRALTLLARLNTEQSAAVNWRYRVLEVVFVSLLAHGYMCAGDEDKGFSLMSIALDKAQLMSDGAGPLFWLAPVMNIFGQVRLALLSSVVVVCSACEPRHSLQGHTHTLSLSLHIFFVRVLSHPRL